MSAIAGVSMFNYSKQLRVVGSDYQGPDRMILKATANAVRDVANELLLLWTGCSTTLSTLLSRAATNKDAKDVSRNDVGLPECVLSGTRARTQRPSRASGGGILARWSAGLRRRCPLGRGRALTARPPLRRASNTGRLRERLPD